MSTDALSAHLARASIARGSVACSSVTPDAASPKRREQSLASQHRNIERTRATRRKSYNNNRDKILAKAKSDRKANPEKYRERKRDAYHANPEKHQKEARDRRAANPEKYRAQAKARYHANPQKFRDHRNEYVKNNREEVNRRAKEKRAANPEKYRARYKEAEKRRPAGQALAKSNARKALKQSAILPTTDFDKIKNLYKERTRLTKKTGIEHHVDHIIQLTLGGAHHQDNLRVITAEENLTRGYDYDPTLGGVWANNDRARKTKKKLGIK